MTGASNTLESIDASDNWQNQNAKSCICGIWHRTHGITTKVIGYPTVSRPDLSLRFVIDSPVRGTESPLRMVSELLLHLSFFSPVTGWFKILRSHAEVVEIRDAVGFVVACIYMYSLPMAEFSEQRNAYTEAFLGTGDHSAWSSDVFAAKSESRSSLRVNSWETSAR